MTDSLEGIKALTAEELALFLLRMRQRAVGGLQSPLVRAEKREQGAAALSFGQQRLWFIHQLEPNSSFNPLAAIRLRGVVSHTVLEGAISEINRRHEALRTVF